MKVKGIIESDVDTFKVGDVIEVKLADGVKVQAMAVQQEEDGMIFCLADCLPGEHPMNSTSTNEGGYEESDLRKKLNGEMRRAKTAEPMYLRIPLTGIGLRYCLPSVFCIGKSTSCSVSS